MTHTMLETALFVYALFAIVCAIAIYRLHGAAATLRSSLDAVALQNVHLGEMLRRSRDSYHSAESRYRSSEAQLARAARLWAEDHESIMYDRDVARDDYAELCEASDTLCNMLDLAFGDVPEPVTPTQLERANSALARLFYGTEKAGE